MPLDMLPMQPDTILETSDMPEEPDIPITVRCLETTSGPPPNKRPRTKEEVCTYCLITPIYLFMKICGLSNGLYSIF